MGNPWTALRRHWPEYLMEAWGLATLMLVAGSVTTLLEYPGSPIHALFSDAAPRRLLAGLAIGATLVALVYSPWGRQSGAHFNPAVTLAFLHLRKVAPWDATFYMVAQFIGGASGILVAAGLLGSRFSAPPVEFIVTVPGVTGELVAFAAELAMTFIMMGMVLIVSNSPRIAALTGLLAGALVGFFIFFAAPLSGASLNPARTLSSALPAGVWSGLWIYLVAPALGMLLASESYRRLLPGREVKCAKLIHDPGKRCIHCGYRPGENARPSSRPAPANDRRHAHV